MLAVSADRLMAFKPKPLKWSEVRVLSTAPFCATSRCFVTEAGLIALNEVKWSEGAGEGHWTFAGGAFLSSDGSVEVSLGEMPYHGGADMAVALADGRILLPGTMTSMIETTPPRSAARPFR